MPLDLVQTLCELVAIPSVNPMGRDVAGPEYFEYRLTDYLQELFERLGLPYQRQAIEPKRDNIIARVDGDVPVSERGQGGQLILFEAHQDTVPVDGMTIEPWTPTVRDGRVYGRGSCDIKGGMCAMLGAVARLAEERPRGMPTIIMACTVNEEHGYSGALALPRLWTPPFPPLAREGMGAFPRLTRGGEGGFIIPRRPDAAVVAEPTLLNVVVAHKGAVRWRCHTRGRACHSSQPQLGDNALYKMAQVLLALRGYQQTVVPQLPQHRLCGPASLSVGTIRGGISVNTVPDKCTIEIDRRLLPGEEPLAVYRQVKDWVAECSQVETFVDHDEPFMNSLPLSNEQNGQVAQRLAAAAKSVTGSCEQIGVPFGTDAATISQAGVPSVVFGPGSIDQAHTCDEWLEIEQLDLASEILYRFAREGMET